MSQTKFNKTLVALSKSKVTLKLNKPVYDGMCILDLSKLLIYKFHFDYSKNKYYSKSRYNYSLILIVCCIKLKPKMFMKILVRIKKCLILVIIQQVKIS